MTTATTTPGAATTAPHRFPATVVTPELAGEHPVHPHAAGQPRGRAGHCEGCGAPVIYLPRNTGLCRLCAGDAQAGRPVGTAIAEEFAAYQDDVQRRLAGRPSAQQEAYREGAGLRPHEPLPEAWRPLGG